MKRICIFLPLILAVITANGAEIDSKLQAFTSVEYENEAQLRDDLTAMFAGAEGSERDAIEDAVATSLPSELPVQRRLFLMHLLELFGTEKSVDALSAYLQDADLKLRDGARRSLAAIPGEKAVSSLALALRASPSDIDTAAIFDLLAYRKEPRAVAIIVPYLESDNAELVSAAASALGRIGAEDAQFALKAAYANGGSAQLAVESALLDTGPDAALVAKLFADASAPSIKVEAFSQLVSLDEDLAERELETLLATDESIARSQIIILAAESGREGLLEALADDFPSASAEDQVLMASAFAQSGLNEYEGLVLEALASTGDSNYRNWLIDALGDIGSDASFEPIYEIFQSNPKNRVVGDALSRLQAPSADRKAMETLENGSDVDDRIAALKVVTLRNTPGANALINRLLFEESDKKLSNELFKSLETIGDLESVGLMVKLVGRGDSVNRSAQRSLKRLCQNLRAGSALWRDYFKPALYSAETSEDRERFIVILDGIDSEESLNYLKEHALDLESPLNDLCTRTLSRWASVLVIDVWSEVANKLPEKREFAVDQIKRTLTGGHVTLSDDMNKVEAWARAIQNAPDKKTKLSLLTVYEEPPSNIQWIIKWKTEPILNDTDITNELNAILAKCG
ncbi:HEAT repeat domain-containing protein [Rubellicoccus peritrichatus]|uniref:HEAT repeat domain-containing protein n=1 Tax=Rubellicoccus peritrichatus TaxID=3080537 RepID=A0AAQ3LEU4_9BACT|nr:hypothetical protein [Puniceicoccus sp. CR14]WOO40624.1 hypothetical protein RZN69_18535 [Puniceicoccus sp. CR14]